MKHVKPDAWTAGHGDPLSPAPRPGHFIVDRWEVLHLVKDIARPLGIGEREIAVLSAHLTVFPKGLIRSDQLLMSYAEVTGGMLTRANCMDERRFRRGEAKLEEVGLLTRKLSANGRRFPVRDGKGRVVDAYGIDLRPLFLRLDELAEIRTREQEAERRREALRSRISAGLSAVKRQALALLGHLPAWLSEMAVRLRNLLRRAGVTLVEMQVAERELEAERARLGALGEGPNGAGEGAVAVHEPSPEDDANRPESSSDSAIPAGRGTPKTAPPDCSSTDAKPLANAPGRSSDPLDPQPSAPLGTVATSPSKQLARALPDSSPVDPGQSVRHIEATSKEIHMGSRPLDGPSARRRVWALCPNLQAFYPAPPDSPEEVARRVVQFAGFIGLGQAAITPILHRLGWQRSLLILDYMAGRVHLIDRPQGYLSALLKGYENGEAVAGGRVGRYLPEPCPGA